jgi:D-sedoheptulose 7-phosphate isomerase
MTKIKHIISASIETKQSLLKDEQTIKSIQEAVEVITHAFNSGHKVYFCGNGGSAADAQHLAAEFSGRFYKDRPALPADALHSNSSYLTAVANDYGYEQVYARIIEGIGQKGDVLVGLSTSGNSNNIVRAFEVANKKDITTIGLTGENGGKMKEGAKIWMAVPSTDTPRIQESHILIGHIICQLVEENYFG